jgi:transposase/mannose-6-phosphate isomerase-like protein (cupin superfamily)
MRKIRDVLRLHYENCLSKRRIAPRVGLGVTTVADYLRRFRESGLNWPLPAEMADSELERRLFPVTGSTPAHERPLPDWAWVHQELRRKGVTLSLVWEEYRTAHPDGLGFTAFCNHYRAWERRLPRTMRHRHRAGEKLFVDYAGYTVPISDPATGETHHAAIFVAVLGASSLTYAEASWSQGLSDWLASHANTFASLGGVPAEVVCDNLKSGVTTPDRYEPRPNASYAQLAAHYGTSIAATRVAKPRDKAKVEAGVQVVTRALARLRHRTFFSLSELNDAIRTEIDRINSKVMRHMGESRRGLFERLDRPELGALPRTPYQPTEVRFRTVGRDYHVNIDQHGYSVPHELVGAQVEVHVSRDTVEIHHDSKRVAVHPRSTVAGEHSTQDGHRPPGHRAEHWVVIEGVAEVTCDDNVFHLYPNQSTYIPLGAVHRLANPGDQPLHVIEVQSGDDLGRGRHRALRRHLRAVVEYRFRRPAPRRDCAGTSRRSAAGRCRGRPAPASRAR